MHQLISPITTTNNRCNIKHPLNPKAKVQKPSAISQIPRNLTIRGYQQRWKTLLASLPGESMERGPSFRRFKFKTALLIREAWWRTYRWKCLAQNWKAERVMGRSSERSHVHISIQMKITPRPYATSTATRTSTRVNLVKPALWPFLVFRGGGSRRLDETVLLSAACREAVSVRTRSLETFCGEWNGQGAQWKQSRGGWSRSN